MIYKGSALETVEKIREGKKVLTVNKKYKHSQGWFWYVNQKGYYHILRIVKVKLNNQFLHYAIKDLLVTKDSKLRETNVYGNFETVEAAEKSLQED